MFWVVAFSLTVVTAFTGALISKAINSGLLPWYCAALGAILSGLAWGFIAKNKTVSLTYASVLFDVLYALTYVTFFCFAGDPITPKQTLGVCLAVLAILVMGWP